MFLLIAFGAGTALFARAIWEETRKLKNTADEQGGLGLGDLPRSGFRIQLRGVLLLFVPMLIGHGIDLVLGTPVTKLIG